MYKICASSLTEWTLRNDIFLYISYLILKDMVLWQKLKRIDIKESWHLGIIKLAKGECQIYIFICKVDKVIDKVHAQMFYISSRSVKMLVWKLGSELPNLIKKFQSALKIWTRCRLNFHEVERKPSSARNLLRPSS